MDSLLHRFGSIIKGSIEGFDRLVFKGTLKPISFALGMQAFLRTQGVLNKEYKDWVTKHSDSIIQSAEGYSQKHCSSKIIYIPSIKTRKEELAHNRQKEFGITEGLIGVWSCVENCRYLVDGNKFLHINDYELAQKLLTEQVDVDWEEMLSGFARKVFPTRHDVLLKHAQNKRSMFVLT